MLSLSWIVYSLITSSFVHGRLIRREVTSSSSNLLVATSTSANCTVAPTACYLSNAYPVALRPGLPCTVPNTPCSDRNWHFNSITFNVSQVIVPQLNIVGYLSSAEIVSPWTIVRLVTARIRFARIALSDWDWDVWWVRSVLGFLRIYVIRIRSFVWLLMARGWFKYGLAIKLHRMGMGRIYMHRLNWMGKGFH